MHLLLTPSASTLALRLCLQYRVLVHLSLLSALYGALCSLMSKCCNCCCQTLMSGNTCM